jgi:hypothetical protein
VGAIVLGSVGTATASGLTAGAVKKIAAKVVAKKAPRLSVAHAASADTATEATRLGGHSAAELQTTAYRYTIPVGTAVYQGRYAFPGLPAGTYLVSYSVTVNTTSSTGVICSLQANGTSGTVTAQSYGPYLGGSGMARCSGSNVVTLTDGVRFYMQTIADTYTLSTAEESIVSFVPVATVTAATATRP